MQLQYILPQSSAIELYKYGQLLTFSFSKIQLIHFGDFQIRYHASPCSSRRYEKTIKNVAEYTVQENGSTPIFSDLKVDLRQFFSNVSTKDPYFTSYNGKCNQAFVSSCTVLSTKSCFMKQKCHLQIGVTQHKNAARPLSTSGINTTHQHFQMGYMIYSSSRGS